MLYQLLYVVCYFMLFVCPILMFIHISDEEEPINWAWVFILSVLTIFALNILLQGINYEPL